MLLNSSRKLAPPATPERTRICCLVYVVTTEKMNRMLSDVIHFDDVLANLSR